MSVPSERGIGIPGIDAAFDEKGRAKVTVLEVQRGSVEEGVVNLLMVDGYSAHFRDPREAEIESEDFDDLVRFGLSDRVLEDPYKRRGSTITLAVELGANIIDTYPIACARLGFGVEKPKGGLYPLEAEQLVEPLAGWERVKGEVPNRRIGEIARVTVSGELRSSQKEPNPSMPIQKKDSRSIKTSFLVSALFGQAVEKFREHRVDVAFMIMQNRLKRHIVDPTERLGVGFEEVPMRLRTEDPEAARTFEDFSKYWHNQEDPPKLYKLDLGHITEKRKVFSKIRTIWQK